MGEIYEFVLKKYNNLRFSPSIETTVNEIYKNPKRMKREVRKQLAQVGMGTKSQKALKLQWENTKLEHGQKLKNEKEKKEEAAFLLRQMKKKEKHKGR